MFQKKVKLGGDVIQAISLNKKVPFAEDTPCTNV